MASIGDDQPHSLEPELFKGLVFLFKIFEGVLLIDAVRLECKRVSGKFLWNRSYRGLCSCNRRINSVGPQCTLRHGAAWELY
jgi:hypothetical protein